MKRIFVIIGLVGLVGFTACESSDYAEYTPKERELEEYRPGTEQEMGDQAKDERIIRDENPNAEPEEVGDSPEVVDFPESQTAE